MSVPAYLSDLGQDSVLSRALREIRLIAFDFDGVFTDNGVWISEAGIESVRCCRSDGIGLSRIKTLGITSIIISTEINPVVSVRAKKLKIDCLQGIEDKAAALADYLAKMGLRPDQAAFVGNDINDIPAFRMVRLPVAVADSYAEVLPHVLYRTLALGGKGAVREICDLLYQTQRSKQTEPV